MTPEISILLPAFEAAKTLGAALRSIQRQSEQRWECVVVDDGSRDGTREIALAEARNDARVRVVPQAHRGLVAALNAGLAECRAPLIARMDADDLMSRERLRLQRAALLALPEVAAVGCHVRLFPRAHLRDGRVEYERWLNAIDDAAAVEREAFVECPVAHPSLMIRGHLLRELGYRDRGWPEDYDLLLRLLEAKEQVGTVPRRLLHWRDGAGRLSRIAPQYCIPAFVRCKAAFLSSGFLARSEHYILWGYGDTGKALADALAQKGKRPAAILELHPRRIGQIIRGVRVASPEALPQLPRFPLVVSVAGLTARTEIRAALSALGFRELTDYVCAA